MRQYGHVKRTEGVLINVKGIKADGNNCENQGKGILTLNESRFESIKNKLDHNTEQSVVDVSRFSSNLKLNITQE